MPQVNAPQPEPQYSDTQELCCEFSLVVGAAEVKLLLDVSPENMFGCATPSIETPFMLNTQDYYTTIAKRFFAPPRRVGVTKAPPKHTAYLARVSAHDRNNPGKPRHNIKRLYFVCPRGPKRIAKKDYPYLRAAVEEGACRAAARALYQATGLKLGGHMVARVKIRRPQRKGPIFITAQTTLTEAGRSRLNGLRLAGLFSTGNDILGAERG